MRYRYRRNRWGWRGFPIPLFFILFFVGGHSWISFLVSVGVVVLIFLLIRWLLISTSGPGISGVPPTVNQPYQQQGSSPYYQPPYQPYQQGYQGPQSGYEQGGQGYQSPEQHPEYEQYEQPQAEYPQEMPPMEQ